MAWNDGVGEIKSGEVPGVTPKRDAPVSPAMAVARNEYLGGMANTLGGIGDAPARAWELGKAFIGSQTVIPQALSQLTGKPESTFIPEPNIDRANMFTNFFRDRLGHDPHIVPHGKFQKFVGGVSGGAGASAVPLVQGNNLEQLIGSYISQLLIGASAGAGAELAGAATNDNPLAKLAGGFLGGVIAPSRIQQVYDVKKALTGVHNPAQSQKINTMAENIAQRSTRAGVSGIPGAAERLEEGLALQSRIPGFQPSIAEMVQEPKSAISFAQRQFTQLRPENINRDIARRQASMSALDNYLESMLPKGSSAQIRGEVNTVISGQADDLARQQTTLTGALPNVRQTAVGETLQAAARAEKSAMQPVVRAAYERAFDAAGNTGVPLNGVIARVEDILGQKITEYKPDTAPFTVRKLMELVKPAEKAWNPVTGISEVPQQVQKVSLRDLDGIRSALNADARSAVASADPTAAMRLRNLTQVHTAIDEAISGSQLPQTAKDAYTAAIAKYREEFAPRFKEGLNMLMFKSTRLNEDAIRSDEIIGRYFRPGGEVEATQLTRLLGGNVEGKKAASTGILDLYRTNVVNPITGEVDLAKHSRFVAQYEKPLKILANAGIDAGATVTATGRQAARLSDLRSSLDEARSLLRFDTTESLIDAALKSPRTMQALTTTLDVRGRSNLARTVMQDAFQNRSASEMLDFLTTNQRTLQMAMSAASGPTVARQHYKDLLDIQKGLAMLETVGGSAGITKSGTDPLRTATGVSIATVWAQTRAVQAQRQGVGTAVAMVAGPMLTRMNQIQFDEVMNKALNDPETARNLVTFLRSPPARAATWGDKLLKSMSTVKDVTQVGVGVLLGSSKIKNNFGLAGMPIASSLQNDALIEEQP